ncbi:MAG: methylhydantoinase, partial [Mesorhizobium sp.]
DGTWRSPLLSSHKFGPNEAFEFLSTGGGGWGVARSRNPERVREDVIDGYISAEAARRDYGVAIDPKTLEILSDETSKLRQQA